MTTQSQTCLRICYRHEKAVLADMVRAIPPEQMEPGVRKVYEAKKAAVAELERKMRGS